MTHEETIIVWEASGVILNSEFDFPPDRRIMISPSSKNDDPNRSKMTFFDGKIEIVFDDNNISINQSGDHQLGQQIIVYYLSYKTFLNYNCLSPTKKSSKPAPEIDTLSFNLHRYVTKYTEEDGKTYSHTATEPCEVKLDKKDIADFLMMHDMTVMYAICYYLLGCETQQYFLIEFYKCLEVIKNHFKKEKKMKKALSPHGFDIKTYDKARESGNHQREPLSIGRHAPKKGIPVHSINTKWLFSDPKGKEVFRIGEKACRNIIDSYIKFRITSD